MCESAALLVEHRLQAVPWRQWVLSFEGPMAVPLGYDPAHRAANRGPPPYPSMVAAESGSNASVAICCVPRLRSVPTADGQVRVHFKKPSHSGATDAQMSPQRFLARLCALVPPPGAHNVRYYGVLAPRHALRARIIPTPQATNAEPKQLSLFVPQGQLELAATTRPALNKQLLDVAPRRLSWMRLLASVFLHNVSVCQRWQGPIRVLRAVTSPHEIAEARHAARAPTATLTSRTADVVSGLGLAPITSLPRSESQPRSQAERSCLPTG